MARRRIGAKRTGVRSFARLRSLPAEAIAWLNGQCELRRQGVGPTAPVILSELQARWGMGWNDSGLSRYQEFYETTLRIEDQAHDEAVTLAKYFMDHRGPEARAELQGMLEHSRLVAASRFGQADPVQVFEALLKQDGLELKRRELSQRDRQIEQAERKLQALEARQAAADKQVAGMAASGELPVEVAQRIRAMYGLADASREGAGQP